MYVHRQEFDYFAGKPRLDVCRDSLARQGLLEQEKQITLIGRLLHVEMPQRDTDVYSSSTRTPSSSPHPADPTPKHQKQTVPKPKNFFHPHREKKN